MDAQCFVADRSGMVMHSISQEDRRYASLVKKAKVGDEAAAAELARSLASKVTTVLKLRLELH